MLTRWIGPLSRRSVVLHWTLAGLVLFGLMTAPPVESASSAHTQESSLDEMYRAWAAAAGDEREALGARILTNHFGTREAEAVAYTSIVLGRDVPNLEMARRYVEAGKRGVVVGLYTEFVYRSLVGLDPDPLAAVAYGTEYLNRFPRGQYRPEIEALVAQRYGAVFINGVSMPLEDAVRLIEAVVSRKLDRAALLMSHHFSRHAVADMFNRGDSSEYSLHAARVARIGLERIAAGLNIDDPAASAAAVRPLNLALGIGTFHEVSQRDYADEDAYEEARKALELAVAPLAIKSKETRSSIDGSMSRAIGYLYLARIDERRHEILRDRFEALPENSRDLDEGRVLDSKAVASLRSAVESYVQACKAQGLSTPERETVKIRLSELYPLLHPENPNGWVDELRHD